MFDDGISIARIAELLNAHRNTIANKLDGRRDFKVAEIMKIKNAFFPDSTVEELYAEKAA
ncbi:MAG: hypothetical protein LBL66_09285 [Clostridiales bacterium]|nr:hypothetical protein [Clostridiales bacterium]